MLNTENKLKTTTIYTLTLLAFLFIRCNNADYIDNGDYWDISKFNMDTTALEDNEEVKILYANQASNSNTDAEYYNHVIVVSQKTGDTVNVLTAADNFLANEDKDKIFSFLKEDNVAAKIMQMDPDDIGNIKNIDDINKIEIKKINKVARYAKSDAITNNSYPTIIGAIGTFEPNK